MACSRIDPVGDSEASEDIYKAQQEATAGDGAPAAEPTADATGDVKDVDFEVVDEDEPTA